MPAGQPDEQGGEATLTHKDGMVSVIAAGSMAHLAAFANAVKSVSSFRKYQQAISWQILPPIVPIALNVWRSSTASGFGEGCIMAFAVGFTAISSRRVRALF